MHTRLDESTYKSTYNRTCIYCDRPNEHHTMQSRMRAHLTKSYFLRRLLTTGEETTDEGGDGGADEANAANLLFLRNSQ